jgi:hypothetical protein
MRFADKSMSPTEQLAWGALQKLMGAGKLGMYIAAPDDIYNFPYLCCAWDAAALLTMALPGVGVRIPGRGAGAVGGGGHPRGASAGPDLAPRRRRRPRGATTAGCLLG